VPALIAKRAIASIIIMAASLHLLAVPPA